MPLLNASPVGLAAPNVFLDGTIGLEPGPLDLLTAPLTALGPILPPTIQDPGIWLDSAPAAGSLIGEPGIGSIVGSGLAIIDAAIPDYENLISGLQPGLELLVLDRQQDGIQQITQALTHYTNLESLHIFSHGFSGGVQLGSSQVTASNLGLYTPQLQTWQSALSADADILIYGCNLGSTAPGNLLISTLSTLTGADIAASDDLTGSAALGGDWDLELTIGSIETDIALNAATQAAYGHTLATIVVNNTTDLSNGVVTSIADLIANDGGDGISLREAITAANNTVGNDIINFDLPAGPQTISIGTILPALQDDVQIFSTLGTKNLTIQGNPLFAFDIFSINTGVTASFDQLTIVGGLRGILNDGTIASLRNSHISGCQLHGIFNRQTIVSISNSTISNCQSHGIRTNGGTIVSISNSTISSNQGDGIFNNLGTIGTLNNVTIAANTGNGINNLRTITTLSNSILAGNGTNFAGDAPDSENNNLQGALAGVGLDGTLADNGDPTPTHALLPGSIAIDAAGAGATATDQRGLVTFGGTRDIGAFESNPLTLAVAATATPVENTLTNGIFTIVLGQAAVTPITVNFNLIGSTATSGGVDYTLVAGTGINTVNPGDGTLEIAAGVTTATLVAEVVNDIAAEAEEIINLTLTGATGAYQITTVNDILLLAANDTTVTNTNDSGEGSLRQAVINANALPGDNTIDFALPAGPQTINLLTQLPNLADTTGATDILNTTGANNLTIQSSVFGIFDLFTIEEGATASFDQLTLRNGAKGITNLAGTITSISNSVISGHRVMGIDNNSSLTSPSIGIIESISSSIISNNGRSGIRNNFDSHIGSIDDVTITEHDLYGIENWSTIDRVTKLTASYNRFGFFSVFGSSITTLSNSTLSSNAIGILIRGFAGTLDKLTIANNLSDGLSMYEYVTGNDSAILNVFTNSVIFGNGYGIRKAGGTISNIDNITISGNQFDGILNLHGTINTINNVTITLNARNGLSQDSTTINGVTYIGTTVNLKNSILAGNGVNNLTNGLGGTLTNNINNLIDTLANIGLDGTLADNGGSTLTHALLPGSPAIDAAGAGATASDQRDIAAVDIRDIGAFESRKFTIAITDGNHQTTQFNTPFATDLSVQVTSAFGEPVTGGNVTFTPPITGASASLSNTTVILDANRSGRVTATANSIVGGPYTVSAGEWGIINTADFSLTNTLIPNTAPTLAAATLNGTNGDITVAEGATVTLQATAIDPNADSLTFTLDGTVAGAIPGIPGSTRTSNLVDRTASDSGTVNYTFQVSDGIAAPVTVNRTVTITNLAPTATFENGGSVSEGGTGTVRFTAQTDPSTVDRAAGFRYAYDFDNDGTFEIGDGTYAGSATNAAATVPAIFLAAGPDTRQVRGRILDKDGDFTDYTTDVTITNASPMIAEGATIAVIMSEDSTPTPFALTLNATDPGADPLSWIIFTQAANGTASVSAIPTGESQVIRYTPTTRFSGTDSFVVRVSDNDGGTADITVNVTVQPVNNPSTPDFGPVLSPVSAVPPSLVQLMGEESQGIYEVVGSTPGQFVTLAIDWITREALFDNELGFFLVDDAQGTVNGIALENSNYLQTAIASANRQVIFQSGQGAGSGKDILLPVGSRLIFYLVQDTTTENWLATNPQNSSVGNCLLLSKSSGNPNLLDHAIDTILGNGVLEIGWEDILGGGDRDFNDMVIRISNAVFQVPGAVGQPTRLIINQPVANAQFQNEIGYFFVDDFTGQIGNLRPGDAGYARSALAAGNFQPLFQPGQTLGGQIQVNFSAGKLLGWYLVQNRSSSDFLFQNPANSLAFEPVAFFSFVAANPDGKDHVQRRSATEFAWEDWTDLDFDDAGFQVEI